MLYKGPGLLKEVQTVLQIVDFFQFQTELRKILVSLIDAAQKLICLNPAALKEAESENWDFVGIQQCDAV